MFHIINMIVIITSINILKPLKTGLEWIELSNGPDGVLDFDGFKIVIIKTITIKKTPIHTNPLTSYI